MDSSQLDILFPIEIIIIHNCPTMWVVGRQTHDTAIILPTGGACLPRIFRHNLIVNLVWLKHQLCGEINDSFSLKNIDKND